MGCPAASKAALTAAPRSSGDKSGEMAAAGASGVALAGSGLAAISGRGCGATCGREAGAADPMMTASGTVAEACPKGLGGASGSLGEPCGTARGPGTSADISGLPKGPLRAESAAKGEMERGGSGARRAGAEL